MAATSLSIVPSFCAFGMLLKKFQTNLTDTSYSWKIIISEERIPEIS